MNCDELVNALAGYEPLRTWYVRRFATAPGFAAAAAPAVLFRKADKAALEGARMVMLLRAERVLTIAD